MTTSDEMKCQIAEEELKKVWPEWHVVEWLGGGSFGDVYHIYKESFGVRADSALKIIQVNDSFADNQRDSCGSIPNELVNEIRIMEILRGAPNIVSVEDFSFIRGEKACSLFVRMELLSSFQTLMFHGALSGYAFRLSKKPMPSSGNMAVDGRIAAIFEAAMDHKVEALVLGAYGCGSFHNPPDVVAEAFRWALTQKRYSRAFKVVAFALTGDPKSENNAPFLKRFA